MTAYDSWESYNKYINFTYRLVYVMTAYDNWESYNKHIKFTYRLVYVRTAYDNWESYNKDINFFLSISVRHDGSRWLGIIE